MLQLVNSSQFIVHRKKLRTPNYELPTTNYQQGFSLIEIVLALFLVLALISILLTASATLTHSRRSNLQSLAAKIASREIENLRDTTFTSLPSSGPISDPDLSKLPSSSATRTVLNYQGSSKIKQVSLTVNWTEKGVAKQVIMETLIAENGL